MSTNQEAIDSQIRANRYHAEKNNDNERREEDKYLDIISATFDEAEQLLSPDLSIQRDTDGTPIHVMLRPDSKFQRRRSVEEAQMREELMNHEEDVQIPSYNLESLGLPTLDMYQEYLDEETIEKLCNLRGLQKVLVEGPGYPEGGIVQYYYKLYLVVKKDKEEHGNGSGAGDGDDGNEKFPSDEEQDEEELVKTMRSWMMKRTQKRKCLSKTTRSWMMKRKRQRC